MDVTALAPNIVRLPLHVVAAVVITTTIGAEAPGTSRDRLLFTLGVWIFVAVVAREGGPGWGLARLSALCALGVHWIFAAEGLWSRGVALMLSSFVASAVCSALLSRFDSSGQDARVSVWRGGMQALRATAHVTLLVAIRLLIDTPPGWGVKFAVGAWLLTLAVWPERSEHGLCALDIALVGLAVVLCLQASDLPGLALFASTVTLAVASVAVVSRTTGKPSSSNDSGIAG